MDCIFCKIASGEIPATKVYEDDTVVAFNDLEPKAPVHILIIPKQHITNVSEVTPDNSAVVAHIFEVAAEIAREQNLTEGLKILTNCGKKAGQTVMHLHFHLLAGGGAAYEE